MWIWYEYNSIKLTLKDVDVIQLQPFKTFLDRIKDVLPTQAMLIDVSLSIWVCYGAPTVTLIAINGPESFGHNDDFISGKLELFDCFAKDDLRKTIGVYLSNR